MISLNEEAVILEKLKDPFVCITDNPGFWAVCLNQWVLRTAWYQYTQQYDNPQEGPEHQKTGTQLIDNLHDQAEEYLGGMLELCFPLVRSVA